MTQFVLEGNISSDFKDFNTFYGNRLLIAMFTSGRQLFLKKNSSLISMDSRERPSIIGPSFESPQKILVLCGDTRRHRVYFNNCINQPSV